MSGTNKLKVVFINHWAEQFGGAEHSLLDILAYAPDHYECHLITSEQGLLVQKAQTLKVTCHVINCSQKLKRIKRGSLIKNSVWQIPALISFLWYVVKCRNAIQRISPHIVHANVPKSHITLFLMSMLIRTSSLFIHMREIFKKRGLSFYIYSLLFPKKRCHVIAISKAVRDHLPLSMKKRCRLLYNGVTIPSMRTGQVDKNRLRLLYLGRVVPWKGCHLLLDVLHTLNTRNLTHSISLSIIGNSAYWADDYRQEIQGQIIKYNLSNICSLMPYTNDTYDVYTSHDLFVNASFQEPFGRAIAEAHSYSLPVVAFDSGGIREIVHHNESGFLLPYNNCKAFADAIEKFVTHPALLKSMGSKGRIICQERFNKTTQVQKLLTLFKEQKTQPQ